MRPKRIPRKASAILSPKLLLLNLKRPHRPRSPHQPRSLPPPPPPPPPKNRLPKKCKRRKSRLTKPQQKTEMPQQRRVEKEIIVEAEMAKVAKVAERLERAKVAERPKRAARAARAKRAERVERVGMPEMPEKSKRARKTAALTRAKPRQKRQRQIESGRRSESCHGLRSRRVRHGVQALTTPESMYCRHWFLWLPSCLSRRSMFGSARTQMSPQKWHPTWCLHAFPPSAMKGPDRSVVSLRCGFMRGRSRRIKDTRRWRSTADLVVATKHRSRSTSTSAFWDWRVGSVS